MPAGPGGEGRRQHVSMASEASCHAFQCQRLPLALRPLEFMPDIHVASAQGPDSEGAQTARRPLRVARRLAPLLGRTFTSDLTTTGIFFSGDTRIEISYVHGEKGDHRPSFGPREQVLFSSEANAGWEAALCLVRVRLVAGTAGNKGGRSRLSESLLLPLQVVTRAFYVEWRVVQW